MTPRIPAKFEWLQSLSGADALTHAEFRVLVVMSNHADSRDPSNVYPGLRTIAREACVDDKTARNARKSLVAKGWLILLEEGGSEKGRKRANRYRLGRWPEDGGSQTPGLIPPVEHERGVSFPGTGGLIPEDGGSERYPNSSLTRNEKEESRPNSWCDRHPGGVDRPCRACGHARAAAEAWASARAEAAKVVTSSAARAAAEARAAATAACALCDDAGYRDGALCDHDPGSADRARRGLDAVRAEMGWNTTPRERTA